MTWRELSPAKPHRLTHIEVKESVLSGTVDMDMGAESRRWLRPRSDEVETWGTGLNKKVERTKELPIALRKHPIGSQLAVDSVLHFLLAYLYIN